MTDTDERLRELEGAIRAAEPVRSMESAVRRASIEEVPQAAHLLNQQMTAAIEQVAAETEALAALLMDKAARLRQFNSQVVNDLQALLTEANQIQHLAKVTASDYRNVGQEQT